MPGPFEIWTLTVPRSPNTWWRPDTVLTPRLPLSSVGNQTGGVVLPRRPSGRGILAVRTRSSMTVEPVMLVTSLPFLCPFFRFYRPLSSSFIPLLCSFSLFLPPFWFASFFLTSCRRDYHSRDLRLFETSCRHFSDDEALCAIESAQNRLTFLSIIRTVLFSGSPPRSQSPSILIGTAFTNLSSPRFIFLSFLSFSVVSMYSHEVDFFSSSVYFCAICK